MHFSFWDSLQESLDTFTLFTLFLSSSSSSTLMQRTEDICLWNFFLLMGTLMEDKRDASWPALPQHGVLNSPSICAMVPLREVTSTVCILPWSFDLDAIDTSATFEPVGWWNKVDTLVCTFRYWGYRQCSMKI